MFLLLLVFVVSAVNAHNWINSPSRAGDGSRKQKASTVKPTPKNTINRPHLQVRAGQKFQIEWVTAHKRYTYLTMIKKSDAAQLSKHDSKNQLLDNYFKEAPAQFQGRPKGPFQKFHRKQGTENVFDPPERGPKDKRINPPPIRNFFQRRIPPNDALHVKRDALFKGSFRGAPRAGPNPNDVTQWQYKDAHTAGDRWATYKNNKYPWIIGGGRWLHSTEIPDRPDFAMLEFPANTPPGDYIIQYRWSGFYDGIDVRIVNSQRDVANPYGSQPVIVPGAPPVVDKFSRVVNCDYPSNTRVAGCRGMKAPLGVPQACINDCLKMGFDKCNGVLVAPINNPNTVWSGFRNRINVKWDNGQCKRPTDGSTHVCYALKSREGSALSFPYWSTTDSEDPAFYSTCFARVKTVAGFDAAPAAEETLEWEYRGKCISCEDRAKFSRVNMTPVWRLTNNCVDCDAGKPRSNNIVNNNNNNNVVLGPVNCNNAVWLATGATQTACGSLNNNKQIKFGGNMKIATVAEKKAWLTSGGRDDQVRLNTFDSTKLGSRVTIALMVHPLHYEHDRVIIAQSDPSRDPSASNTRFGIFTRREGNNLRIRARLKVNRNEAITVDVRDTIPLKKWVHVAVTYDGRNVRVYLDGSSRGSKGANGNFMGHKSWPVMIARNPNGNNFRFNGAVRNIVMLNRALIPDDIDSLAKASRV